jgi:hypothetical protein
MKLEGADQRPTLKRRGWGTRNSPSPLATALAISIVKLTLMGGAPAERMRLGVTII